MAFDKAGIEWAIIDAGKTVLPIDSSMAIKEKKSALEKTGKEKKGGKQAGWLEILVSQLAKIVALLSAIIELAQKISGMKKGK